MKKNSKIVLFSVAVGLAILVAPSVIARKPSADLAPTETLDVSKIYRDASQKALPSFEDQFDGFFGDLDPLRPFP